MFVSQAHSARQQSRLAITLAWVAGYTNTISILTCATVTSHTSGTTSNFGREVAQGEWDPAGWAFFLLVTFFMGAMISGFATETGRRRGWESIYVLPMAMETLLLAGFAVGLELYGPLIPQTGAAIYCITGFAAAAMGLQNATITRISGGMIRTTHVTGVLTDLGSELAKLTSTFFDGDAVPGAAPLHRVNPHLKRCLLLGSVFGGFAVGACLGAVVFDHAARFAMFPPVLFLVWIIYQDVTLPIAEILTSADVGGALAELELPPALAVYHLRKDPSRHGKAQRMPNLMAWSERLPKGKRVVILDLADVTELDNNMTMELRSVLGSMRSQGRWLLIAGLDQEHLKRLHLTGANDLVMADHICPDLELAIAHGLNLVEAH
jgi:uncharacterized membrane protein YoaK (UPF0700 family)/anti-anti-sigma regulatory factor